MGQPRIGSNCSAGLHHHSSRNNNRTKTQPLQQRIERGKITFNDYLQLCPKRSPGPLQVRQSLHRPARGTSFCTTGDVSTRAGHIAVQLRHLIGELARESNRVLPALAPRLDESILDARQLVRE